VSYEVSLQNGVAIPFSSGQSFWRRSWCPDGPGWGSRVAIPFSSGQSFRRLVKKLLQLWDMICRNPFFIRSMFPTRYWRYNDPLRGGSGSQSLFHQVNVSDLDYLLVYLNLRGNPSQSLFHQVNVSDATGRDRTVDYQTVWVAIPFSSGQCFRQPHSLKRGRARITRRNPFFIRSMFPTFFNTRCFI